MTKENPYHHDIHNLSGGAFYRVMAEHARDIIIIANKLGSILDVNQAATAAYGYSAPELCKMRVHDLYSWETVNEVDANLNAARQESRLFRTVHVRRNGELLPVEVSIRLINFLDKDIIIYVIRDIAEAIAREAAAKKAEEKRRLFHEALEAAYDELAASEARLKQQLTEALVREEAIQRQNTVLALLHDTALALMQRMEVNGVLKVIISKATELIGTSHGFINLVDEEKGILCRKIGIGYFEQDLGRNIKLTDGLSGHVYQSGEIVVVDDYSTWEKRLDDPFYDKVHSVAHVPLKAAGKVIGTIGVASLTTDQKFTAKDIAFLSRFADLAAIALANNQLINSLAESETKLKQSIEELTAVNEELIASEEEMRQQFDELLDKEHKIHRQNLVLTSIHETVMALMRRLELEEVLKAILSSAAALLGVTDGHLNLVDEQEGVFVRKAAVGRFAQDMARKTAVTDGLLGQAYTTGQIAVENNYSAWEGRLTGSIFDGLYCCVIVPLKIGDKVIGALCLVFAEPGRTVDRHELFLLQRFADMAAIAIDNATLVASYKNELFERRRAEETIKTSEAKYRAIFETANDGIIIHDITGRIIDVNEKACKIWGCTKDELLSGNMSLIGTREYPYTESEARKWIERAEVSPQLFEWQLKCKDGQYTWAEVNLQKTLIGDQERVVAIVRDVSERKEQEQIIRRMAYNDPLTDLPNRTYLKEILDQELVKARRGEAAGSILFIDLDDFKMVNDTFGHSCGDSVIKRASAYIVAAAGPSAVVARLGGDEFIVVLPGEVERRKVEGIASNIVRQLGRDYDISGAVAYISASVGIALYPDDGDTVEDALKHADLALYAAKQSGKNTWRFFETNLQKAAYENLVLKQGLREAIKREELSLHYQPQVSASTFAVVSFEALLRWTSAEFGSIPPGRFIPLAEESETILSIGKWAVTEACQFARKLKEMGKGDIRVSVNVSPRQLLTEDFVPFICGAINTAGISPDQLEIEITEDTFIASMEECTQKLRELREFGVHLALDDFGSGYCSLNYLRKLPIETIKIDKSFIDEIETSATQLRFVNSIINMAHVQGLNVVAEGVETQGQLDKLMLCNCNIIQGYFFSKPMVAEKAIAFLDRDAIQQSTCP